MLGFSHDWRSGPRVRKGLSPKTYPVFDDYEPHHDSRHLPPADLYYLAGVSEASEFVEVFIDGERDADIREAHVGQGWAVRLQRNPDGTAARLLGRLQYTVLSGRRIELRPSI